MIIAPSTPEILLPLQRKPYLEIYCQLSYGFLVSSIYNMIIIIACCYFAFRARNVPSNYNESKFIAVSVYSTLIVCLAALPVYATAIDVSQKILTLTVALMFNTYLTLACLYLPKIYAIHFAGEEARQTWRLVPEGSAGISVAPFVAAGAAGPSDSTGVSTVDSTTAGNPGPGGLTGISEIGPDTAGQLGPSGSTVKLSAVSTAADNTDCE